MMQSLTKIPLTFETAQKIAAAHLGSQTSLTGFSELTEGFYNAAYRLETDQGLVCVLKIAPPPGLPVLRYEKDILRAEVEALRLVKAQTNMPVPEVLFYDSSLTLLSSPFFGMEFIPGEPLHKLRGSMDPADKARIDRQTGEYLRQMNQIGKPQNCGPQNCELHFGYYAQPESQHPTWRAAFDQMLNGVLQDGADAQISLHMPNAEILTRCRRHYAALDEVRSPALVHWDLWDGNIFVDPQTKTLTGIIDFERCLWADPLMEANFGAFGINPDFFAGYGKALPFTPAEQTRRSLYNVYLYLIMVIECTYRQYPTHDQENWARGVLQAELEKLG